MGKDVATRLQCWSNFGKSKIGALDRLVIGSDL